MAEDPAHKARRILRQSAENVEKAHKKAVGDAANVAKKAVLSELDKVTSGRKLRNVGKSGGKLGVKYSLSGDKRAKVKATGPWQIIERDTKSHRINRKGANKKRALKLPDGGYRRSVPHPGTKGKHPFEKGQKAAVPKVHDSLAVGYRKVVAAAWK